MVSRTASGGGVEGAGSRAAPRVATVAALQPRETMQFDQARLVAVCDLHGTGAEAHIACVLDVVEAHVARAATQAGDPPALARTCEAIAEAAAEIGMTTMEQAAHALGDCLRAPPTPGIHAARDACLQRLLRLGRPGGAGGWAMSQGAGPDTVA